MPFSNAVARNDEKMVRVVEFAGIADFSALKEILPFISDSKPTCMLSHRLS